MDTLVVGIDGGDERILASMDLDFLPEFFSQNGTLHIEEDLWNRGWGSILSGYHGTITGGFYEKPKLDGSHDFEQSFGTQDYQSNPKITPLWKRINQLDYSVGFMNVRTTMPAPEVNGFFVSGAGGGFKPSEGVPEVACYPTGIHSELANSEYIWETRFLDSGVTDFSEYIDLVSKTVKERTNAYINLYDRFNPDFGFIAQTETVGIQNLAMVEIESIIDDKTSLSTFQRQIVDFYQLIDSEIYRLITHIDPTNIVIVSDHGAAPYRYSINVDDFLQRIELQPTVSTSEQKSRQFMQFIGGSAPQILVDLVSKARPSLRDKATRPDTNWNKTLAFGHRYVPGIYINDQRFNGPVEEQKREEILDKILTQFNDSKEAEKYNIEAKPYRSEFTDVPQFDLLPDIWIHKPDTMFFEGIGEFIQQNDNYFSIENQNLADVERNMHTGKKGGNPIVSFSFDYSEVNSAEEYDLTIAYDIIVDSLT